MTRADTIVDGSGVVVVADGGTRDAGGVTPWPALGGGVGATGGLHGGGGGQATDGWVTSCQADTAGVAGCGVISSAAGGLASGDGTIGLGAAGTAGAGIVAEVAVIVGALEGVSGGI